SVHDALVRGAREAVARIDINTHAGVHPRVGALDVAPIVYLREADRGAAIAAALVLADRLGEELALPVHLYGQLGAERAALRRQLPATPDFGPATHPTAGATLVTARPPLVAFNVVIDADLDTARAIAARVRQLPAVKALGVPLRDGVQLTTNLEDFTQTSPAQLVAAIGAPIVSAELVALAPEAAFADFPPGIPMPGFEPDRQLIERALATYTDAYGPDQTQEAR
ncbi:MAG: glutamate formiminotransferase / 5-formyltetrahydrofolate cyclo-ligase, partial [Solirubrobacteraceae bacterium]|nr:glutamate formiminotransferase / 5-formyltetrahydrofolate cyclo-ligase [Solirubrobacteraceae bacterium]